MDRGSQLDKEDEADEEAEDEEEKEKEKEREEEEKRKAADIKSNNPHLAGGEKLVTFLNFEEMAGYIQLRFPTLPHFPDDLRPYEKNPSYWYPILTTNSKTGIQHFSFHVYNFA